MDIIKKRSEMDPKYTWATEDLYANDKLWNDDFDNALKIVEQLSSFKGSLGESADKLFSYLKLNDELSIKVNRIFNYAQRKFDEDTKNATYQDLSSRIKNLSVKIGSATAFETPEILAIPEKTLDKFYKDNNSLLIYEILINEIRRKKEHILSEKEEKILAAAEDLASSPSNIMSMFRNADLEFPDVTDENGNSRKLTAGTYTSFIKNKDQRVRKEAFMNLHNTLDKFKNTSASSYFAHVKQLMFYANARNYNSTLEKSLDESNVPTQVYKNLVEAVHQNMHYMHKYVKLRKKLLNLDELHMYDLYTPVVKGTSEKITFEEAKKNVYEAVAPLGKEYQAILKEGFENRWIDVYENDGKRSGAYSAGAKVHPFVLLNYADNINSEFTLAHEMGHAIHSYLSNKTQPTPYTHYKTFVAEVASTCNEALLMEYLLSKTTDKVGRANLINHFLEQFKGTIFRQTMFAEFEMLSHQMAESGKSLTADVLNKLYYDLNVEYFGDDIVVDNEVALEWSRIPHFFFNFYVYQYATGYSAAIALSRKILNDGDKAVKRYLKFLGGGCSLTPIELLEVAGIDMKTSQPINDALELFGSLIDELEELLAD
ncbi:oligoendopeptidase F [Sedimentibacter sp. zth1]|uniref:oligoendopeptidase F n=1 Tax=Sedimentibacter sp. zth1 TaxID=2816908 RepID=UPI001F5F1535|nr:oligoendopeptidase F [Sedimentibacter sp. zth1]